MADAPTVAALKQASQGLTYQSETDAPWAVFGWPEMTDVPTADGVRRRGRHRASAPVAEQSVEDFFALLTTNQDWYGDEEKAVAARYRSLLTTVQQVLTNLTVTKVGKTKVAVYVVGQAREGGWAGLNTTAVETG